MTINDIKDKILEKIEYSLYSINNNGTSKDDKNESETIYYLAQAYKILREEENK